jgi:hypothetical protein
VRFSVEPNLLRPLGLWQCGLGYYGPKSGKGQNVAHFQFNQARRAALLEGRKAGGCSRQAGAFL